MSELTCKCLHPIKAHIHGRCCPYLDTSFCKCTTDFDALHRAIVEAAMRFEADTSNTNYEALIAAVRALREAAKP